MAVSIEAKPPVQISPETMGETDIPIPDYIHALRGCLKDTNVMEVLMEERRRERQQDK